METLELSSPIKTIGLTSVELFRLLPTNSLYIFLLTYTLTSKLSPDEPQVAHIYISNDKGTMELESMTSRLGGTEPIIEEIMYISGAVDLSYGKIQGGQVVHKVNFGFRNVEERFSVDSETIFPICSMRKGLVSSALGTLVEEGKLSWESFIHQLLPLFTLQSSASKENATLLGFLSMRWGIGWYNIW